MSQVQFKNMYNKIKEIKAKQTNIQSKKETHGFQNFEINKSKHMICMNKYQLSSLYKKSHSQCMFFLIYIKQS